MRALFGSGIGVHVDLEGDERPGDVHRLEHARMHLAENGEPVLRAEPELADAAGVIPVGPRGEGLQLVDRRADRGEHRQRVGLGVEEIDGAALLRPVARAVHAAADAGGADPLVLRPVAGIDLADLEERKIGKAARHVAPGRGNQVGQERGAHVGKL